MDPLDFTPEDERVDSPLPFSQPAADEESSSQDTPTRLMNQLRKRREYSLEKFPFNNSSQLSQLSTSQTSSSSNDVPPLLSVLNVVVDHAMVPPTPMEPKEFREVSQKKETAGTGLLVPVLRVFGPMIRGDDTDKPIQSACLYIHGAFPYLLARPVVAGPDGSIHHASHLSSQLSSSGYVDWDNVESVERIVPDLQSNLEAALQSYENNIMNKDNKNDNKMVIKSPHFIRCITVVKGRGFYTYCPGPTAPFLRVEYYNPKLKWLVKRTLERGLDVPMSYHPDPQQYDAAFVRPAEQPFPHHPIPNDSDALKFHCYEAHIPYTMQFFKDYNLSGMSYIQVSDGRFRGPVPKMVRQPTVDAATDMPRLQERTFLASTVPPNLLWENQPHHVAAGVSTVQQSLSHGSSCTHNKTPNTPPLDRKPTYGSQNGAKPVDGPHNSEPPANHWIRNETSCDLEIDVCTHDILNVRSVTTGLPDDPKEREQIHWRAVPSLREIWRQERQRMSSLLKPQDDFLSHSKANSATPVKPPPFTLNVKKGASVPGTRLAVAGMKRLFKTVTGTEEDFRLAMKDIVEKHSASVTDVDHRLLKRASTACNESAKATPPGDTKASKIIELTPTEDEAMDALGALARQFDGSSSFTTTASRAGRQSPKTLYPEENSPPLTQDSQDTQLVSNTQNDARFTTNMEGDMALSQRVDRGDGITDLITQDGSLCNMEDFINPQTLTPYDDPEDLDDEGFLDDEDRMGEEELERTLSAMAVENDSFVGSQGGPLSYEKSDDEYDAESTLIASDTDGTAEDEDNVEEVVSLPEDDRGYLTQSFDQSSHSPAPSPEVAACGPNEEGGSSFESIDDPTEEIASSIESIQDPPVSLSDLLSCVQSGKGWIVFETRRCPPSREEVIESLKSPVQDVHPTSRNTGSAPDWLEHSSEYQRLRSTLLGDEDESQFVECRSGYLETSMAPPTRKTVESWLSKKRKREDKQHALKQRKYHSARPNQNKPAKGATNLQIDENSRKLTALPASGNKRGNNNVTFQDNEEAPFSEVQEIEEAVWDDPPSQEQSQELSLSSSQNDNVMDEKDSSPTIMEGAEKITDENPQSGDSNMLGQKASGTTSARNSSSNSDSLVDTLSESQMEYTEDAQALDGIGQIGGRIYVEGGGGLKAKTSCLNRNSDGVGPPTVCSALKRLSSAYDLPMPLSVMSIEIHVQCRTGRAGVHDSKEIAMKPNSEKDMIFAVVYVCAQDPGGGEALEILERGCLFVPSEKEHRTYLGKRIAASIPRQTLGVSSTLKAEPVRNERHLLLRLASIVRLKDPDMLLSWDTQGAGLGYIIERGALLGKQDRDQSSSTTSAAKESTEVDMVRLLGRTPKASDEKPTRQGASVASIHAEADDGKDEPSHQWAGSGLGSEWDDRVGPGAAAASIVGRLVFCGWKIIADEVKHPNASYLPAMVSTVLNQRIPHHDDLVLTKWYGGDSGRERWRVLQHRLAQGTACLLLFDALDVVGRAGEAARLSGVDFSQSFPGIRGSQYKVEGVLLRALRSIQSDERGSKSGEQKKRLSVEKDGYGVDPVSSLSIESNSQTQSPWKIRRKLAEEIRRKELGRELGKIEEDRCYYFYSPSREDSGRQEALECQALTLEPESGCYHDPVVVCDFTALYPSLVIAYNLCYSTVAGRLEYHSTRREMRRIGQTTSRLGPFTYPECRTATVLAHHMKSLCDTDPGETDVHQRTHKDRAYVVPTGTIFVAESVLKGVLPQVLDELLSTRAMLKKALKEYKRLVPDLAPSIQRQLEARQLALKYVANVTYGYTSATFSGRCAMPLLADAIVECARKTLRNAIDLANQWGRDKSGEWFGAKVIYGDTDSVFVKLPGRTVKEAFKFGEAFCNAVTASNPPPVQLKLEKVYGASMMQTKKKYCGMKYDSADQRKPTFEAKGIETVRRDQCALTQKVLRNALITLFRRGVDAVKAYMYRQWSLIRAGRLPVSDFILTGRVRSKYRGGRIGPVQAALARRLSEADPGRTVRHKERLAYVIVATPGSNWRLRDCVLTPTELLEQWDAYSLHAVYYITKHVNAALQRCLGLSPFKVNVNAWYEACPKPRSRIHFWPVTKTGSSQMISSYFGSDACSLCGGKCKANGRAKAVVCAECRQDDVQASHTAMMRLSQAQQEAQKVANICSRCNGCYESTETFAPLQQNDEVGSAQIAHDATFSLRSRTSGKAVAGVVTPLANCSCIDCPKTFERHRLRETELEAIELCKALDLI